MCVPQAGKANSQLNILRTVIDSVINQHGNVLIEFLEESKMCIATINCH